MGHLGLLDNTNNQLYGRPCSKIYAFQSSKSRIVRYIFSQKSSSLLKARCNNFQKQGEKVQMRMCTKVATIVTCILAIGCGDTSSYQTSAIVNPYGTIQPTTNENKVRSFGIYIGDQLVGNGFFVKSKIFVTNAHVSALIEYCHLSGLDCAHFYIKNDDKMLELPQVPVSTNLYLDYSVYEIPFEGIGEVKVCKQSAIGTKIKVISRFDDEMVESLGEISGKDLNKIKKPSFLHNSNTHKGMSGSPVLDAQTNCVHGLHWGTDEVSNKAIPFNLILGDFLDEK